MYATSLEAPRATLINLLKTSPAYTRAGVCKKMHVI